ncbi:hypothetical protein L1276_004822 [Flavobacterium sp. HSC-32F16]|nr:hypothetical protein [Flavobacterium sp. HSC-32F16]
MLFKKKYVWEFSVFAFGKQKDYILRKLNSDVRNWLVNNVVWFSF